MFENIMQAVTSTQTQTSYPTALSNQQIVENHRAFEELQRSGVYLPDLMKRLESLETQVKTMSEPDPDLFPMMEAAVRDSRAVQDARRNLEEIRTRVLNEMVLKDPRVSEAVKAYRTTVREEYRRTGKGAEQVTDTPDPQEVQTVG